MPHFRVHELLSRDELDQLEAFAREPGRTVDECTEWLQARGFVVNRSSVGRWKREFDQQVLTERFSRSSELARAMKDAVAGGEFGNVADAAIMQLTQVIFEQSIRLEAEGKVKSGDLLNMGVALRQLVGSKQQTLKMAAEKFDAAMAKTAGKRAITPADIDAVRKAVFG
jgi:hypothetical protein